MFLRSAAVAVLLVTSGCAGDSPAEPEQADPTPSAPSVTPSAGAPEEGTLVLESGDSVPYSCLGEGTPGVLLEAGGDSAGTGYFGPWTIDPLAKVARVCSYDRLGLGGSDSLPERERTLDDVCDVQDEVRRELGLGERVVLVGHSLGANVVIWCASRHPDEVAGLVSVEGYHDDPEVLAGLGFDWRSSLEYVDAVKAARRLDDMSMPIGKFPVVVISARHADPGGARNQRYWLGLSPDSRQVVLNGGHELHIEFPKRLAREIRAVLDAG